MWIRGPILKLFIECKFSETTKPIPASEVREFLTDFSFLKGPQGYNKAILVSNAQISKSGKAALHTDQAAELKTLDQLQSEALQIDEYLKDKITEFEINLGNYMSQFGDLVVSVNKWTPKSP